MTAKRAVRNETDGELDARWRDSAVFISESAF